MDIDSDSDHSSDYSSSDNEEGSSTLMKNMRKAEVDNSDEEEPDKQEANQGQEEDKDSYGQMTDLGAGHIPVKSETQTAVTYRLPKRRSDPQTQRILSCLKDVFGQVVQWPEHEEAEKRSHGGSVTQVIQFKHVEKKFDVHAPEVKYMTVGGNLNVSNQAQGQGGQEKTLTWTEQIRRKTVSTINSWTEGMVKTSVFYMILQRLKTGSDWVTLKGSPGEGKTTVAYMVLKELNSTGRQVFNVTSSKQFFEIISTCLQPVIMLDDIFGNPVFDTGEFQRWKPVLHLLLDLKEHRSHEDMVPTNDVTIILVGRDYVLNSVSCDMGRLSDFFSQDEHVVNMPHASERGFQEKVAIINAIAHSGRIDLDENTIAKICQANCPHGYPHVCRLFVTHYKRNPKICAETFFCAPIEFLNQTIKKFMKSEVNLQLFQQMIKHDGKISVRELQGFRNSLNLLDTAEDMVGTYLKKEDDCFVFDHSSIFDCVAFNFCKYVPLFVISSCNLSFIHERLRLYSCQKEHDGADDDPSLFVHIPRVYIGDLAKRFAKGIENQKLHHVLSHKSFKDEQLIKDVMSQLTIHITDVVNLTDEISGETFLSLMASSRSPQLLKYIDRHMTMSADDTNMVLYGVCRYAASDVLRYLTESRVTLDINVPYGIMKQSSLMIAAETRDSKFVDQILELNPNLEARDVFHDKTVLHYLCANGLASAAEKVIGKTSGRLIDVKDWWGCSALWYACRGNKLKVVKLLLQRGASVEDRVVAMSCRRGSIDIVRLFFEKGFRISTLSCGEALMHSACLGGHKNVIGYLSGKGISVNTAGLFGRYPLHAACLSLNAHAVQYLLEKGADVDKKDRRGNTPLHLAAELGSKECAEVLLKSHADATVQNVYGSTPLHLAEGSSSDDCLDVFRCSFAAKD